MTIACAPIDHLFVRCCPLPLPDLERYRDNMIFLDLLPINFLRYRIEKSGHCRSLRNISRHHAAAIPRRNGTPGFEQSRKGVGLAAFCECQSDLVVYCFGYDPREDGAAVVVRIIVIWSSAILSRHDDAQESDSREYCQNASHLTPLNDDES